MGLYFMVEITTKKSGEVVKALWDYPDLDTAVMNFHNSIASAMANAEVSSFLRMVIDESGIQFRHEFWQVPAEPELEPNEPGEE